MYYSLEIKKLLYLPTYRYSLLVIAVLMALVSVIYIIGADPKTSSWAMNFTDTFEMMLLFGTVSMIVIAAQFASGEYTRRTVQLAIASGVSRQTYLFAKSVALIVGAFGMVAGLALVGLLLSTAVGLLTGTFVVGDLNLAAVLLALFLSPLKMLPLVFISFFLTVALRSSVFPMSLLIVYSVIGEILLIAIFGGWKYAWILNYFPQRISTPISLVTSDKFVLILNIAAIERNARALEGFNFGTLGAIGGVFIYVGILLGASYLIFVRQDLSR